MTHEFHHQIDALMEASGYPEYFHADQPWKMPGRFGEDFDFNARIIRNADPRWWLNLKFGTLAETPDTDDDGLPDDDRSLPFDERRCRGNPTVIDSDGDGLGDLQEVMAGNAFGSSLDVADSDGDGITDSEDPEPLYPFPPVLPKLPGSDASWLTSVPGRVFARRDSTTSFHLAWDDSALYAGVTVTITDPDSVGFLFQLDAGNDGWFHGFDNTQIRVRWSRDTTAVVDYYLRDCSSWAASPADRKDILRKEDLGVSTVALPMPGERRSITLVLRVPGNARYGPVPREGTRVAVRLGVQTADDRWVWNELFERNSMMSVLLTGKP
jgi:hypothetical protein